MLTNGAVEEDAATNSGVKNNATTVAPVEAAVPNPTVVAETDSSVLVGAAAAADDAVSTSAAAAKKSQPKLSSAASFRPFEYRNGRKVEQLMYSYETYFKHREKVPRSYYPLVQYLENVEVKYHNDNLFEDSPLGFPTRAQ